MIADPLHSPDLYLLEKTANRKGDLFSKIARDLFHSLGFSTTRMNVHKTGREIDLFGSSRVETRRYYCAECKATKSPIGGDDVNKFVGVLDAEKRTVQAKDQECLVSGFFVSLSGFTETAKEQESILGNGRVTLISGPSVVKHLIEGRIVVALADAAHAAGYVATPNLAVSLGDAALLAHATGFVWAIPYRTQSDLTHCVYVHADGTALSPARAKLVATAAKTLKLPFGGLQTIGPPDQNAAQALRNTAKKRYVKYVEAACGEIQLDGLPADEQVGSKKLKLEHLFVPLHLTPAPDQADDLNETRAQDSLGLHGAETSKARRSSKRPVQAREGTAAIHKLDGRRRVPFGKAFAADTRIAILAAPGGGKSTLLKRIAVAYGIPSRRPESDDSLPPREWLPLFLRCRDLGTQVRAPILKCLAGIAERAELSADEAAAFSDLVGEAVRDGTALLLIDGLDEIADDGDRVAFVSALRTFLATYAKVAMVVTSREAGFRVVASSIAAECKRYLLAEFDGDDISSMVTAWHREVYGESAEGDLAAKGVAGDIKTNDRIRRLAGNPLLLTTLLLVKRWVGQLPNRRTVLYDKAIEVLLATWNVQAHAPMSLEEALPRLEFVAHTMLEEGVQSVSRSRLQSLLQEARIAMPEALAYSRFTDAEFIDRIELRSSLLVQAGHTVEAGRLEPVYEFRHLTFQEYLVARAINSGHYSGWAPGATAAGLLQSHFEDISWREVIPLTAAMAGRGAKDIIAALIVRIGAGSAAPVDTLRMHIAQCLVDDVLLAPQDADKAIREVLELGVLGRNFSTLTHSFLRELAKSKYGARVIEIATEEFTTLGRLHPTAASAVALLTLIGRGWSDDQMSGSNGPMEWLKGELEAPEAVRRAVGLLVLMEVAFNSPHHMPLGKKLTNFESAVAKGLKDHEPYVRFASCWAIAWMRAHPWHPDGTPSLIRALCLLWAEGQPAALRRQAAWAFGSMPVIDRQLVSLEDMRDVLLKQVKDADAEVPSEVWPTSLQEVATLLAYYLRAPWSDAELAERAMIATDPSGVVGSRRDRLATSILEALGEAGAPHLATVRARVERALKQHSRAKMPAMPARKRSRT